jgi:hypothetical protein
MVPPSGSSGSELVIQHQSVRESGHRTHPLDLPEEVRLGILPFAQLFDLPVEGADLTREASDGLQDRLESRPEGVG